MTGASLAEAFTRKDGELFVEAVPAAAIAEEVGTPAYVYSLAELRRRYRAFDAAFGAVPHVVCYSVKANGNLAVCRAFAREGSGFDVTSAGELHRAIAAGGDPSRIVFAGVGKRRDEIAEAIRVGIRAFNVESSGELDAIDEVARDLGKTAPVTLRVNPDVDPKTHPYISTGMKQAKFGIAIDQALDEYERTRTLPNLEVVGVDCHIGSQLLDVSPFADAMARIRELVIELRGRGFEIRDLDFGGGLGIRYGEGDEPPPVEAYAEALLKGRDGGVEGLDVTLLLEPGRWMVGNAGIFLTEVLYRKANDAKTFVIVDGAMNDLIRPALYDAYQRIDLVRDAERESEKVDVVGPICESGDFLARERELPRLERGDLLAVSSAGAYGFTMASNYNGRPRAPEVLVDGDRFHVVRTRETLEDLTRGEAIPDFLA